MKSVNKYSDKAEEGNIPLLIFILSQTQMEKQVKECVQLTWKQSLSQNQCNNQILSMFWLFKVYELDSLTVKKLKVVCLFGYRVIPTPLLFFLYY